MTIDIAAFHKGTKRDGEFDPFAGNDQLSAVHHDGSHHYYDLNGLGVTQDEFESFVATAWDIDPDETVEAIEWASGVYRASL